MGICGSTLNSGPEKTDPVQRFRNRVHIETDSFSISPVNQAGSTVSPSKASVENIPSFEGSPSVLIEESFNKLSQPVLLINKSATDFLWMNNVARRVIGGLPFDAVFGPCVAKHGLSFRDFFDRNEVLEPILLDEAKESLLLQDEAGVEAVETLTWLRVIKLSDGFMVELVGREPLVELLEQTVKQQKAISHEARNVRNALKHHMRGSSDAISQAMKLAAPARSPLTARMLTLLDEAKKEQDLAMKCELYTSLMDNFLLSSAQKEDFILCESINPIVDMLADDESVEFVKEGILAADDEYLLHGHKSLLFYTLVNLIQNAIKFTKHKHQSASSAALLKITVSVIEEDDNLSFSVTDTGIGMTEEQVARCLGGNTNRFNSSVQGSGSGLSNIVAMFNSIGGIISVTSTLGKETSFKFTLPLVIKKKYTCVEFLKKEPPDYTSLCVLGVDDNLINRKMLGKLLMDLGLPSKNIFIVESIEEAYKVFNNQQELKRPIDVVFTDFHLSTEENGLHLAAFIRKHEKTNPHIKPVDIILLSGGGGMEDLNLRLVNKALLKPIQREQLADALNDAQQRAVEWCFGRADLVQFEDDEHVELRLP